MDTLVINSIMVQGVNVEFQKVFPCGHASRGLKVKVTTVESKKFPIHPEGRHVSSGTRGTRRVSGALRSLPAHAFIPTTLSSHQQPAPGNLFPAYAGQMNCVEVGRKKNDPAGSELGEEEG